MTSGPVNAARPRLVLAGLGHAHLFVLEAVRAGVLGDVELIVCTNTARHVYSGMLPGWLGGRYTLEALSFDVPALVAAAGGTWIAQHVRAVDATARTLTLEHGDLVAFDVCSIAVGSAVAGASIPGVRESAWAVKPLEQVVAFAERVDALAAAGKGQVVVVGGGIAGVELALNTRARLARTPAVGVSVVMREHTVVPERGPRVSALCERALADAGVHVWRAVDIEAVSGGELLGRRHGESMRIAADAVVWATGAAAPSWLAGSGLPSTADGYLPVDATLRVIGTERVFAAGDVATLQEAPAMAKAGVYAVRMGPHLVHGLRHALGRGPSPGGFRPQRRWLSLMNLGDGTAVASWGTMAVRGSWAMWLKDRIDRRFITRFAP